MAIRQIFDEEHLRIRLMLVLMLAALGVLVAALWRMQVAHGKAYQRDLMKQSVRRVRLPGMRGRIFDRNQVCVADNRPSYCVAIYLEELRQPGRWVRTINKVDGLIDEMSKVLGMPRQVTTEDIKTHIRKRLPLPLLAWRDVDERGMARLSELASGTPGVDVYLEAVREYPKKASACHVLGYVGRADPPEDEVEPFHYYLPEMAGRSGIEKAFDGVLRGEPGGRLVRVDVSGYRHDDLASRDPKNGRDVILTLDMNLQEAVERAMGDVRGSAVVVDPSNGDVLAMVSLPGFDPNLFVPAIPADVWKQLIEDGDKPLFNRAVAGSYAPGSTFKAVVAMAALENHKANPQTTFSCPGYFMLGSKRFNCWYHPGHGPLTMQEALEHSCNVYFFRLGLQSGYDAIYHTSAALGLGQKTGVALDFEAPGLLPNEEWKRRMFRDGWRDGDTCNLSIGQGALAVTPLQLALVTAALANGGHLYKPRIVQGIRDNEKDSFRPIPPQIVNELNWSPTSVRTVREGMRDVVMSPRGTGRLAAIPGVEFAGKTGTAEYGTKGSGKKYGWMIAFAPFDNPRYAVVLLVEEAVTGGTTAAPKMKQVMSAIFHPTDKAGGQG